MCCHGIFCCQRRLSLQEVILREARFHSCRHYTEWIILNLAFKFPFYPLLTLFAVSHSFFKRSDDWFMIFLFLFDWPLHLALIKLWLFAACFGTSAPMAQRAFFISSSSHAPPRSVCMLWQSAMPVSRSVSQSVCLSVCLSVTQIITHYVALASPQAAFIHQPVEILTSFLRKKISLRFWSSSCDQVVKGLSGRVPAWYLLFPSSGIWNVCMCMCVCTPEGSP